MTDVAKISLVVLAFMMFFGQQIVGSMRNADTRKADKQPFTILEWGLKFAGILMISAYVAALHPHGTVGMPVAIRALGLPVMIGGYVLFLWSQSTIGRYWVNGAGLYKNHKLVIKGPYARIRHPLYTGMLIAFGGVALMSANKGMAVGCALYVLSLMSRIPMEEALLRERFGAKHADYRRSTGYIFPRLRSPRAVPAPEAVVLPRRETPVSEGPKKPPTNVARREAQRRARNRRRRA